VIDLAGDIESDIRALVGRILRLSEPLPPGVARHSVQQWDSLKHMEIIFALEDRYGVRFDESEFAALGSAAQIVTVLRRHRAA
jgi:acyl carrier protein